MRLPRKRRHQPRLPDRSKRDPVLSCVPSEILARLHMDAALCGVRPSYIVADVLAYYYALPALSPFVIDLANSQKAGR